MTDYRHRDRAGRWLVSDVRRTSDPVDEDIEYEMNRELGGLEQREIDRRVRWAREQREAAVRIRNAEKEQA
jgi:hypothetical protein